MRTVKMHTHALQKMTALVFINDGLQCSLEANSPTATNLRESVRRLSYLSRRIWRKQLSHGDDPCVLDIFKRFVFIQL